MIILSERCKKCNSTCNAIHFQQNFENWTSGNDDIDKFIQDTQLTAHDDVKEALEWVPYNRFNSITYIEKIGVYKANWIDGYINKWDYFNKDWERYNNNVIATLKSLNNTNNITSNNVALNLTNKVNQILKKLSFYYTNIFYICRLHSCME
jgi:hypothetical protein